MQKWYVRKIYKAKSKSNVCLDGIFLSQSHPKKRSRIGNSGLYYEIDTDKYFIIQDAFLLEGTDNCFNVFDALVMLRQHFPNWETKSFNRFIKTIAGLQK
jgi:hypothetical protein